MRSAIERVRNCRASVSVLGSLEREVTESLPRLYHARRHETLQPCRRIGPRYPGSYRYQSARGLDRRKSTVFSRRNPVVEAAEPALLLQPRPHGRGASGRCARRTARPRPRAPPPMTAMFSRRATSSSTSALSHRLGRRLPLPLAELLPVDVRLHRIDLLFHQPPDELLDAPIDLAIEQRRRHVERARAPRAASAARRASRAPPRASPRARGRRARAPAAPRANRTRRGPSRTRRPAPARRACGSP